MQLLDPILKQKLLKSDEDVFDEALEFIDRLLVDF